MPLGSPTPYDIDAAGRLRPDQFDALNVSGSAFDLAVYPITAANLYVVALAPVVLNPNRQYEASIQATGYRYDPTGVYASHPGTRVTIYAGFTTGLGSAANVQAGYKAGVQATGGNQPEAQHFMVNTILQHALFPPVVGTVRWSTFPGPIPTSPTAVYPYATLWRQGGTGPYQPMADSNDSLTVRIRELR